MQCKTVAKIFVCLISAVSVFPLQSAKAEDTHWDAGILGGIGISFPSTELSSGTIASSSSDKVGFAGGTYGGYFAIPQFLEVELDVLYARRAFNQTVSSIESPVGLNTSKFRYWLASGYFPSSLA